MSFETIATYAAATMARSVAAIEAELMTELGLAGVQMAGFGDFSVQRALPHLQARAQEQLEKLRVTLVRAGIPTTAYLSGDDWVDVALNGFYQETRIPASKTRQRLTLTTPAGASSSAAVRKWVAQDDQELLWDNIEPIRIAAGAKGTALFECRTAGAAGNAPPGSIDNLVVADPGVTVTNDAGSIDTAGRDAETSADYLIRCLGKWGLLSAGVSFEQRLKAVGAFDFLIPGAASTVTRWLVRDDNPFGPGTIGVCIANAAGPATADEVAKVANVIIPLKPLGSQRMKVFAASPQNVQIVASIYSDGSNGDLRPQGIAALNALARTYPIGSLKVLKLYRSRLIEVLEVLPGAINTIVSSPAVDVGLAPYSVIQLSPAPVVTVTP